MRAIVYARFSTEQQSATSIEDQARVCRERAAVLGLVVAAVHSDAATSGQTLIADRPGGRALLADHFDVLLVESLDRLSRDTVDAEQLVRRLEHRGVRIVGVADGYDTASGRSRGLLRLVRGAISETYIEDLRERTLRGMHGQFGRGYHVTGLSYGYRSVAIGAGPRGEPLGHRLEVVLEQAAIVREVFARYGAGESCQRIAAALNACGERGPRGGTWSVSAIYGSPAKGAGILNNELYVGRYVWNRSRWVKDPDTRRRVRFDRPAAEWRVDERPELRIVSDVAWRAVRERMGRARAEGGRAGRGGMPTTLFGGLLRCAHCGGAVVAIAANSYGCAARRDRGPAVCSGVTAPRRATDELLLAHVEQALRAPTAVAAIERAAAVALARAARRGDDAAALAARERELEQEVGRLVAGIVAVGVSLALADRLREAEAALAAARGARAQKSPPVHPRAAGALVRAVLDDLGTALRGELPTARDALRAAFGEIVIRPEGAATYAEFENTDGRLVRAAVGGMGLVAGARFELATFGL